MHGSQKKVIKSYRFLGEFARIFSWTKKGPIVMQRSGAGLALADRQFVISESISQMKKGNVTDFVNLTKALKRLINSMFLNVLETN